MAADEVAQPVDDVTSALEELALGRAVSMVERIEKRVDDTGAETKVSSMSKRSQAPDARALDRLLRMRIGGQQDWC